MSDENLHSPNARTLLNTGECSFSKANRTKKVWFATLILSAYTHPSLNLSKILFRDRKQEQHSCKITEAPEPESVRDDGLDASSDLNPEKYQFYAKFSSYLTSMFCILRLHLRVSPSCQHGEGSLILFSFFSPNFLWNSGPLG